MLALKSKILKISENKKNVAKISAGTIIGQGVSFITLPILARIYGAQIIGTWALMQSIANIINSFSDFGLTNAIMLEENEDKMNKLYKVITTLGIIISLLVSLILFIYYSIINPPGGLNGFFIGVFMFAAIFTLQQIQVCYTWLNRKSQYKILMKNPIINNTIFGVTSIILGAVGFIKYGYFIGWILGQILTLIHMKKSLPNNFITFNKGDYKEVFSEYIKYIKYQMPTNFISNIKNQIPVIAIKALFGAEILGYYSITIKIMQIPITLLASAMGRVFFQTTSDMKRKGQEIGNFVYNNINKVTKISIIPMIIIIVFGDYAVTFFLGSEWKIAGDFMRILAFQNFFLFLMSTIQGIAVILDKQKLAMKFCVFQSIGFFIGLLVGKYAFYDVYIAIALMSAAYIICNIIYFCILFKSMNIEIKKYLRDIFTSVLTMSAVSGILRVIIKVFMLYFNLDF